MKIVGHQSNKSTWTFNKHDYNKSKERYAFYVPVFDATICFTGHGRGRSAAYMTFEMDDKIFEMSLSSTSRILKNLDQFEVDGKHIRGRFTFEKQGSRVSLCMAGDYVEADYEDDKALELLGLQ